MYYAFSFRVNLRNMKPLTAKSIIQKMILSHVRLDFGVKNRNQKPLTQTFDFSKVSYIASVQTKCFLKKTNFFYIYKRHRYSMCVEWKRNLTLLVSQRSVLQLFGLLSVMIPKLLVDWQTGSKRLRRPHLSGKRRGRRCCMKN